MCSLCLPPWFSRTVSRAVGNVLFCVIYAVTNICKSLNFSFENIGRIIVRSLSETDKRHHTLLDDTSFATIRNKFTNVGYAIPNRRIWFAGRFSESFPRLIFIGQRDSSKRTLLSTIAQIPLPMNHAADRNNLCPTISIHLKRRTGNKSSDPEPPVYRVSLADCQLKKLDFVKSTESKHDLQGLIQEAMDLLITSYRHLSEPVVDIDVSNAEVDAEMIELPSLDQVNGIQCHY